MAIEFRTIDEQIEILERRGLKISHVSKTKKLLMRSNYYDVVNGYASFLQDNTNHFKDGATFEELYAIYMFDKQLKVVFFEYIEKVEAFMRTATAYYFAKNHESDYFNKANFTENKFKKVSNTLNTQGAS